MQSPQTRVVLFAVFAGSAAGALSAAVTSFFLLPRTGNEGASPMPPTLTLAAQPSEGIEDLRADARALDSRVSALELQRPSARVAAGEHTDDSTAALAAEVPTWAEAAGGPGALLPSELRASVSDALMSIRAEEEAQREAEREERYLASLDRKMEALTAKLSLEPWQADELHRIYLSEHDGERSIDELDDRDLEREARQLLRAQTREAVSAVLTPEQQTANDSRGPGRDRGDRGRGGRGPGGG